MEIHDLLVELIHFKPQFPREAILSARNQRAEVTSELLKLLDHTADHLEEILEDPDYMGHIFAAFLLAEFREPQAFPRLLRLLRQPDSTLQTLWSDLIHLCVPRVLAATCGSTPQPLYELAEDLQSPKRVRRQALQALAVRYLNHESTREELVNYLASLLRRAQTDPSWQDPEILGEIACIAFEIHPDELMNYLHPLYEQGLIEESVVSQADLRNSLRRPIEEVLQESRQDPRHRLPFDIIEEMEGWPCYSDRQTAAHRQLSEAEKLERKKFIQQFYGLDFEPESISANSPSNLHSDSTHDHNDTVPARAEIMPGRNDPCPCGSGKKFKKCCANRTSLH